MGPEWAFLDTISLWSAMCFAFSGFEITSLIGQEIKDAERTIPRGIFIAGAVTTRVFARLHPRYRTPHIALIIQSIAASAIFLASVFFTVAGRSTSIQEAYDILVNLTILIYFVPYLYLFAALVRLLPDAPRWAAVLGFAATAISLALTFVPPPGSNPLTYEVNLVVQAAVMLGLGVGLYSYSRRRGQS